MLIAHLFLKVFILRLIYYGFKKKKKVKRLTCSFMKQSSSDLEILSRRIHRLSSLSSSTRSETLRMRPRSDVISISLAANLALKAIFSVVLIKNNKNDWELNFLKCFLVDS